MNYYINVLEYFLSATICLLLTYNFLTTVLFCFQKELLTEKKSIRTFQRLLIVIVLIAMFVYIFNTENIPPELYVLPWIWGFLASHVFIIRKKRWLNELLGLGILLAITIVLFFKQADLIHDMNSKVFFIYLVFGVLLGAIFWPRVKDDE